MKRILPGSRRLPARSAPWAPLLAVMTLAGQSSRAASDTWNGTNDTWATNANWLTTPAVVPGTGDTATFTNAGFATVTGGGASINTLNFNATALPFTVSGLSLDANGMINVAATAGAQTLTAITASGNSTIINNGTLSLGLTHSVAGTTLTFDGTGTTTTSASLAAAGVANAVVKGGNGTLNLGNFSNTNTQGGFTVTGGTVIANNANALSNRNLTLSGGSVIQMTTVNAASFNFATSNISIAGDTTLHYTGASGNWNIGNAAATSLFGSTGAHTVTFTDTTASINGIRITGNNAGFSGTYKLGQNGALTFNGAARGSATSTLNMGDTGFGSHYFSTGVILHDQNTQTITPIRFGALTGTDPAAIMSGRQNLGTNTMGTQFEIGALGTNTTYAGSIRDGHTSNGNIAMNGLPDATNQVTPFTSNYNRNAGTAGASATTELVKTGSGTLTLSGTNTHTGGTVIMGGAIAVSSDAALGAAYDGSLRPFQFTPATTTPVVYSNTDLPDTVLTGGNPAVAATANLYSGAFGNNGNANLFISFSAQNPDTASAGITNTATGSGYISVPAVSFTGGTIASGTTMPVAAVRVTGLLTLDGGTLQTNAGITSNRAVVIGAGGGTIATMGFSSTFSGNVNGSGNLTLSGGGTVTLSSPANNLTGIVTVGANTTLNLAGALSGSVSVSPTGSLDGSGSATGGATILGEISPGNSIGELSFGGSTTLGGIATIELDAIGVPNADLIDVAGAITLGGDLNVSFLGSPGAGTYNIIDATSFSGTFANVNLPPLTVGLTWDTSQLNTQGILTVVPEPAGAALAMTGIALLLRRRRDAFSGK